MIDLAPLKYFDSLYPAATRKKEIQQFIPYLEKGLSSQLVGIPGSGKSNVFRLLSYNREVRFENFGEYEKHLHFVYIDSSEVKDKSQADITKFILISLAFSLGERRLTEEAQKVNEFLKEGLSTPDEMLLFQTLKMSLDYLSIEKKLTVHLLFDKFDTILTTITPQFFNNLRILRNHAKYRFGSVFSVMRPLEDTVDPVLLSDYHDLIAGNIIYITRKDDVGIDFRLSYIDKAARNSVDQPVRDELIRLTGGHAKLTKLSYEAVVSDNVDIVGLREFLQTRATIQGALFEIWNSLLPAEQHFLQENPTLDEAKATQPYLVATELVNESGNAIPLLAEYISTVTIQVSEIISYDDQKNEILLGESSITGKISPSEFKLLKFLAQNKDRIIPKDEIITAVWGDQKSYEGVTDQALDQIFYRLRKKIEQDPANPQHLLTIKGTGYKLVD